MKNKILFSVIIVVTMLSSTAAKAQVFEKGTNHLSLGVGLGGYLSYTSYGDFHSTPTLFAAFDHGVMNDLGPGNLGIGGFLAFKSAKYDYNYGFNDSGKWTDIVIGVRGTYHYILDNDKIDLYGSLSLGVYLESYKYTSDNPYYAGYDYNYSNSSVYYAFSVGGKYMFSEKFGVFAELGYDIAWLKLGVTLGF